MASSNGGSRQPATTKSAARQKKPCTVRQSWVAGETRERPRVNNVMATRKDRRRRLTVARGAVGNHPTRGFYPTPDVNGTPKPQISEFSHHRSRPVNATGLRN